MLIEKHMFMVLSQTPLSANNRLFEVPQKNTAKPAVLSCFLGRLGILDEFQGKDGSKSLASS
jgi:hypothetical protein